MGLIAASMFVALFVYYEDLIGRMTGGNLQLALFCAFIFGVIGGYHASKRRDNR
jgi:TRAP-type C4-dicarboxylate transport system permease large subunit